MTSLTLTSNAHRIAFTSSSGTLANANRRWGVSSVLNDVRGAWNGAAGAELWRWKPRNVRPCRMLWPASRVIRHGVRTTSPRPCRSRLDESGICSSTRGSSGAGGSGGDGSRSNSTDASSLPEMPSMIEWCTLASTAMRSPSSPSITQNSHSGLRRSSLIATSSPIRLPSCSGPPGGGTPMRRMCASSRNRDPRSTPVGRDRTAPPPAATGTAVRGAGAARCAASARRR